MDKHPIEENKAVTEKKNISTSGSIDGLNLNPIVKPAYRKQDTNIIKSPKFKVNSNKEFKSALLTKIRTPRNVKTKPII